MEWCVSGEQLDGKEADAHSDIFSLGALLYEMVTGNRAFQCQTEFSITPAILHKGPAADLHAAASHPARLERHPGCLAEDPDERWHRKGRIRDFFSKRARWWGTACRLVGET